MKRSWTLYMIETENGAIYTGITTDLERRFREHRGEIKTTGAKFFRTSTPQKILFSTARLTQSKALRLEYAIKQLSKTKKLELITTQNIKLIVLPRKRNKKKKTKL